MTTGHALDPSNEIPPETAEKAARLLLDYFMPVAFKFYKTLGYDAGNIGDASAICGYLLAHKKAEVSVREIIQSVWEFKNETDKARDALSLLEVYGWVKPTKYIGRAKLSHVAVNPKVHKKYEKRAAQEKADRKLKQAKIAEAVKTFRLGEEV